MTMATGDTYMTNTFSISLGGLEVETIQSVSGITYGQDVVETRQVGLSGETFIRKQPGTRQTGEVTVVRGMDKSTTFTEWIKMTMVNKNLSEARQPVSIIHFDAHGSVVRRYNFSNAWASQWEGPSLDASSADAAKETVTITYEDVEISYE